MRELNSLPIFSELPRMSRAEAEKAISSRVQTVYLGHGRVLSRVLGDYKLFLSSDDLGFSCHVMLDGYWESWLTVFFMRFIRPGMTVGETEDYGYNIVKDPVHVHDLQATILRCLGIDHLRLTYKFQGRDFRLTDVAGRVVNSILM